jgi:aldehyde:ferredoxin oxidoreductase
MVLAELKYEKTNVDKGYQNRTLYINLSTNEIKIKPVTEEMKQKFIGGKGFDLWLMWNSLPKDKIVKWNDPENEICISSGPLGGTTYYSGSGKSIVTSVSPLTGIIIDSNVGGYYGPYLKFAGFDAIEIQGKADKDVLIVINGDDGIISIENAENLPDDTYALSPKLTSKYAIDDTDKEKQRVAVVSTGPGAEHSKLGCLNFSYYDTKRKMVHVKQAGRGGIGTVFRDKKIKALVCRSPKVSAYINNPIDIEGVKEVGRDHNKLIIKNDPIQNEMRVVGTGHLPEIMNDYDLLPTKNFSLGAHPNLKGDDFPYTRDIWKKLYSDSGKGLDACWYGCQVSCAHFIKVHKVLTGPYKGQEVAVDGPEYETIAGCGSNWDVWEPKWVVEANFYCDTYGIDTISIGTGIAFVMECYEAGVLNKEVTGGLELNWGNADAAMELIHQMARGEGFGVIVGQGIREMKKKFVEFGGDPQFLQDIGMEHKGLEFSEYVTKESLAQQGGYGLTLKGPQHDEAWLIFEDMVRNNLPTFEDKAEALAWFPFWRTWFGINGLCKLPWNDVVPPDNKDNPQKPLTLVNARAKIPKHVSWYAKFYSAVTGNDSDSVDLVNKSEVVYNFQRIFNVRLGGGLREGDSNFPYRAMGPVTKEEYESRADTYYDQQLKNILDINPEEKSTEEKMALLREYRESQYEKLQSAVYKRRGWSKNGCPTVEKVKELGIGYEDVINVIKPHQ